MIRRRRLSAVNAKEVAHMDQANNAAVRRLIPPTPRCCSLAPSVTTSLYSTTVSKALRQPLRASFSERRSTELTKIHLPIGQAMYACVHEIGGGFFAEVCAPHDRPHISY